MKLESINGHPRDINISFKEEGHEYIVVGMKDKPTSVTTLIHKYFDEFDPDKIITKMMSSRNWIKSKYYGKTREEIKNLWDQAGELGTFMHKGIEQYFNGEAINNEKTREFSIFLNFWENFKNIYPNFSPFRTEWLIYDEDNNITGSVDFTLTDEYGNIIIIDWKRSNKITMPNDEIFRKYPKKGIYPFDKFIDCNYHHYSLQLNFYRHILETKYNKRVIYMMLVILHPDQENYQCIPVPKIELENVWSLLNNH